MKVFLVFLYLLAFFVPTLASAETVKENMQRLQAVVANRECPRNPTLEHIITSAEMTAACGTSNDGQWSSRSFSEQARITNCRENLTKRNNVAYKYNDFIRNTCLANHPHNRNNPTRTTPSTNATTPPAATPAPVSPQTTTQQQPPQSAVLYNPSDIYRGFNRMDQLMRMTDPAYAPDGKRPPAENKLVPLSQAAVDPQRIVRPNIASLPTTRACLERVMSYQAGVVGSCKLITESTRPHICHVIDAVVQDYKSQCDKIDKQRVDRARVVQKSYQAPSRPSASNDSNDDAAAAAAFLNGIVQGFQQRQQQRPRRCTEGCGY